MTSDLYFLSRSLIWMVRVQIILCALTALILAVPVTVRSQSTSLILGYSGSGISTDLRRVMDLEKIWEKHGLNVKSVYFNSGSVLTQAMAGGNIIVSDSGVPEMLVLPVSGIFDSKVITV